jgi:hypothetical protein
MFDKTYLLSPQGQADYKAWIKKLTDIASKEAGVSATIDNDGEPVLMLIRGSDHVPEKLRDKNANLYVIKVTIEIKDILMRELEEVEATIRNYNFPKEALPEVYEGVEESIISFLKTRFIEREEILRKAEEENKFKIYDFFDKEDKTDENSASNKQS